MKLWQISPSEFVLQDQPGQPRIVGVGVGSGDSLFIIPMHVGTDKIDPVAWGVEATTKGFPKIRANSNLSPGYIAKISAYSGIGKQVGRIFVDLEGAENRADEFQVIGFGTCSRPDAVWEEVIVVVPDGVRFFLQNTDGTPTLLKFGETVEITVPLGAKGIELDDFYRITDQNLKRWKKDA